MLSQKEIQNLFNIFKTGTLENIELAIEIAKGSEIDLYLNQFEDLFLFLIDRKVVPISKYSIAEKVYKILNLETLNIKIEAESKVVIPANLYFLKNLKSLSIISEVKLWLPSTLSYFENLEKIELQLQHQENFPEIIFDISSLKKLDLSCNLFNELPRNVWKLRQLTELNLCHCIKLNTIPNELFSLPKLEKVYLFQTLITEISPLISYSPIKVYSIGFDDHIKKLLANPLIGMKLLKGIKKENNSLFSKTYTTNLKAGTFKKNNIKNVPNDILDKGLEAIKEYFKL